MNKVNVNTIKVIFIVSVIFKITSPQINLLDKYFDLINQSLQSNLGIIYLERILDGILYICKDLPTFIEHHTKTFSFSNLDQKNIVSTLNLKEIFDNYQVPKEGIMIVISPQNSESIQAIDIFYQYFQDLSQRNFDLSVDRIENHALKIYYHNLKALQDQMNLIFLGIDSD